MLFCAVSERLYGSCTCIFMCTCVCVCVCVLCTQFSKTFSRCENMKTEKGQRNVPRNVKCSKFSFRLSFVGESKRSFLEFKLTISSIEILLYFFIISNSVSAVKPLRNSSLFSFPTFLPHFVLQIAFIVYLSAALRCQLRLITKCSLS